MATESSAIVRFIEIQQQRGIQASVEPIPEPIVFAPTPPARPAPQSSPGPWRWVAGALVVGGLVAAGLYLGKDVLFGTGGEDPVAGGMSAGMPGAVAATEREHSGDDDAPPAAGKVVEAGASAAEVTPLAVDGEPAVRPVDTAAPQTSPNTGFDLRVKPSGAKITLDGKSIGVAPLRVRNVVAGAHVIDIEAPQGYFSRRLELAVELDRPQELRIDLAPLDAPRAERAAAEPPEDNKRARSRSERREEERQSRRERRAERTERAERADLTQLKTVASSAVPAQRAPVAAQAEAKPEPVAAAPDAGSGTLRVGAKPPCRIFIDGKDTGLMTPQRALPLSVGKHSVKLVNQEFGIDKSMRVRIAPGKSTTVIKDFSSSAGL